MNIVVMPLIEQADRQWVPGSHPAECDNCHRTCVISPKGEETLNGDSNCRKVCFDCGMALARHWKEHAEEITVIPLAATEHEDA